MPVRSRNTFVGAVSRLCVSPLLTEVGVFVEGLGELVALITSESFERMGLAEGENVTLLVKPMDLFLARHNGGPRPRMQNCLSGRVTLVDLQDGVLEIHGELDDGSPVCTISAAAIQEQHRLVADDRVWFYFKSMSLIVSAEGRLPEPAFGEPAPGASRP